MLTPEERFSIGMKVLERLRPQLRTRQQELRKASVQRTTWIRPQDTNFFNQDADMSAETEVDQLMLEPADGLEQEEQAGVNSPSQTPQLSDLISENGPFDPYSILIGACEDGLPFTLDLTNASPGSLLIVGDPASGKTRLLRSILSSVELINRPSEVSFSLIARDPQEFDSVRQSPHCQQAVSLDEDSISELLSYFSSIVDQRRKGSARGPAMLLAVDDLALFLQLLNEADFFKFYSLVKHGPRCRTWVIATMAAQDIEMVDERLLLSFRTRLLGSIITSGLAAFMAGSDESGATQLLPGNQFCVPFDGGWIRFWVPAAG